ncbi:MAG: efflux RND transporter periplasmic adaptor subunit [Akkermansiaceae bacterium]|jgi:RND family efflux transporter MFP subunit|nr:efflux RND transporter periplasmic adaptor subunit [Akkermansiaceae bacterium]MDP4646632.1 efflux RND transporter periplasmic adaptor subunit [Akkermansiaceae bacterium]MDP4721040.1 efflux RND transporter periplasmic adaptor subunit [Akkermansiaceae bacterium]MDP4779548.1 efflux RND transporter periplasmic adaptor subunit [Akkermansiaceae bacterium]MDP4846372.1 efflux RND transporter periplasmic adaptor subunit [Akkermansiaceae bacterium]
MKVALKIIIPLGIILLAFVGFKILVSLKPKPESKQPPPVVPIVDLAKVSPQEHAPPVNSYGTVTAYFETGLTPQVSGKINYVSPKFRVGETVDTEHVLVKIDPTDYVAALAQQESALTVAERTYAEEEIRAEQAAGDWKASGRELATASDFVLRKPQLAAAKADMEAVQAQIDKARADLERTEVRAPFAAIITARSASPGNQASSQTSLGTLVSTEKVEIRLPLTAEQAVRVDIPAKATLTSPLKPGEAWEATLVRMEPTVDQQNQVIFAVAEVIDPFAEGKSPLPVGIFANASITAKPIKDSYKIPEAAFVEDCYVWVMDGEGKLKRVEAERIHTDDGQAFVRPLEAETGELNIVTRPLSNFRTGMKVKPAEKDQTANERE